MKRQRAKLWGDGRIYKKSRTRADGTTYAEPKWWLQYSVDGAVRRESSGTDDAAKAQRLLDKKIAAIRAGEPIAPTRSLRLSDLEKRFFDNYADKKRRSTATAKGRWKHIAAFFDMDRKALGITTDELAAYGRQRAKDDASDSTINRELAALKHAYRLALHDKVIAAMPSFPERRKEPEPRSNIITPEQHQALRAYLVAEEPAYADVLDFSMLTAWRKSQVLSLEWEHVSKDAIRAPGAITKNEKAHVIPINDALRAIVECRRAARVLGSPWVFCRKNGEKIGDFEKVWKAACSAAGCAGTLFHDTRRSGITALSKAGIPEGQIMRISGHKTRSVFDRYNIANLDDLKAALDRVSARPVATVPRKVAPKKHHRRVVAMGGRRN